MEKRPDPEPLDVPAVPFAVAGIAVWVLVGVVLMIVGGHEGWVRICVAGVVIGIGGLLTVMRHDRGRALEKAREHARP